MWAMGAQIGLSALSSFLGSGVQRYQQRAQAAQQGSQAYLGGIGEIKQLSKMLDQQGKQNEFTLKADQYNFVNAQYNSGLAGVQDAMSRRLAAKNSHLVQRTGALELGTAAANSAAVGTIGSSVQAVSQDIQRNTDRGLNEVEERREIERDQFNQSVRSLYTNYYQTQQFIDDTLPDVPDNPRIYAGSSGGGNSFLTHLGGAAINSGLNFLSDKIKLGLGAKPTQAPAPKLTGLYKF